MSKIYVKLAFDLSKTFHVGMKYGTQSYFNYHVQGVVNSLKIHNFSNDYIIVGYLHDIVEDTAITIETIRNLFGDTIADAVDAITKRNGESREQYLIRCSSNKIARIVKLHDAMFNATNCHKNKNKQKYNYYIETISFLNAV